MTNTETMTTEVVVVGSGPGGAAVARKLSAAGRRVLILEWGDDNPPEPGLFPNPTRYFGGLRLMKHSIMKTSSAPVMKMVRGLTTGGSTMMYAGVCEEAPPEKFAAHGIDLDDEIRAIKKDIVIRPLADEQLGEKARMLAQSARQLGLPWKNCDRFFLDPAKFRQGSLFMGDRTGARWDARRWVLDAVGHGATLLNGTRCEKVLIEQNRAIGVQAVDRNKGALRIQADTVVLAAGGIGSPQILRNSGLAEAGQSLCNDPYLIAFGYVGKDRRLSGRGESNRQAGVLLDGGVTLADATVPGMVYMQMLKEQGIRGRMFAGRQALSLLVEIADDSDGSLDAEGGICKHLTARDLEKLEYGKRVARDILQHAGARDIWFSRIAAVHPAGTCRIGEIVDADLKTRFDNVYVADASVLPESLAVPPVLTILALGGRLAGHLLRTGQG
ncbi:GMC family oxidoreductase N-terminal domain-containing protein [Desulfobulbus elongatus]|uniref:GMC family oxidoreductase N-terminal domain-containing protein n=1 Tax=Desulfobulbus elongatus TaxID=53332 RepID=UPI000A05011A|nr:GMC family oxidoreductase N-terminal domain-containing protein [Desulfobulbus elongatus]